MNIINGEALTAWMIRSHLWWTFTFEFDSNYIINTAMFSSVQRSNTYNKYGNVNGQRTLGCAWRCAAVCTCIHVSTHAPLLRMRVSLFQNTLALIDLRNMVVVTYGRPASQ